MRKQSQSFVPSLPTFHALRTIVGAIVGVVVSRGGGAENSSTSKNQPSQMEERPTLNSIILNSSDPSAHQYSADLSGISIQTADGNMTYAEMQLTLSTMVDEAMKEMASMTDEELTEIVEENEAN